MGEDGGGGSARRRTQPKKKTGEDGRRREKTRGDERRTMEAKIWTNGRGKDEERQKGGTYCHAAPGGERDKKWCPHQGSNPRTQVWFNGVLPLDHFAWKRRNVPGPTEYIERGEMHQNADKETG